MSGTPVSSSGATPRSDVSDSRTGLRPAYTWHIRRLAGLGALLLGALLAAWLLTHRSTPVRYLTVPVTQGPVTRAVSATGTVNPELTVIVGSYVSGVIQEVFCDYNTQVKQGQVCARIDSRTYQATVDQDRANLAVARAQLEKDKAILSYAEVTYRRNSQLAQRQYTSQDAADNAKSAYEQAKAQVALDQATIAQRQAQLGAAEVNLGYTDIASPVDGTVVSRNVTKGQTVAATFQTPTLFLIASDLTKMQVDTNVSESDIGNIKRGNAASFTVDAYPDRVFRGMVTQVRQSPQTVQNVVTYDVVVGIANPDLVLRPGMTAAVQIVTAQRANVLRVPVAAFRYRAAATSDRSAGAEGEARVWVLRDGKPEPVSVTRGLDDLTNTEIVRGDLRSGDQVITGEQRDSAAPAAPPRLRM